MWRQLMQEIKEMNYQVTYFYRLLHRKQSQKILPLSMKWRKIRHIQRNFSKYNLNLLKRRFKKNLKEQNLNYRTPHFSKENLLEL